MQQIQAATLENGLNAVLSCSSGSDLHCLSQSHHPKSPMR
jgi:hypothetical protein